MKLAIVAAAILSTTAQAAELGMSCRRGGININNCEDCGEYADENYEPPYYAQCNGNGKGGVGSCTVWLGSKKNKRGILFTCKNSLDGQEISGNEPEAGTEFVFISSGEEPEANAESPLGFIGSALRGFAN